MTESVQPLHFIPRRRPNRLRALGDWMAAHRPVILGIQWVIVLFYAALVVLPAFLPHPQPDTRLFSSDYGASSFIDPTLCATDGTPLVQDKSLPQPVWHERLVLAAQYLFWGVWWPFVILSVMFMGRVWCGVLCPEGALSEWASRHGRAGAIPRWLRWSGWPAVAFVLTTVYGQLISVYEYPQAALLILGGSTVAAMAVGWLWGRNKRVWCRYLCPVSGVFALLARLSPLHYRVDREAWARHTARVAAVNCTPLLNVSQLTSMANCHACGRCSGHKDAVELALRSPNTEILQGPAPRSAEALLLLFGVLGTAMAAFQWTLSPLFVQLKQGSAEWLLGHGIDWPLQTNAPWWLLTHQEATGDLFSWLDGAAILAYIGAVALALGGLCYIAMRLAQRCTGVAWQRLTLTLTPLAGMGLFLGLSMMSATHLRAEGVALGWLPAARATVLALAVAWSLWLGLRMVLQPRAGALRSAGAMTALVAANALVAAQWVLVLQLGPR